MGGPECCHLLNVGGSSWRIINPQTSQKSECQNELSASHATVCIPLSCSFKLSLTRSVDCFTIFPSKEFSFVLIQSEDFSFFLFFFLLLFFLFYTPSRRVHFHKHCTPHKSLQTTVTCEGNLKWAEHLNHDSLCNVLYMLCVRKVSGCISFFSCFFFFFV